MPFTLLPVTLVLAGVSGIINLWLSFRIGQVRRSEKVFVGDGGNDAVIRRMRAQANFVENAPFVLALVGLIEFSAGTSIWLWIAAVAFILARVAHPFGMDSWRVGRMVGTLVSMVVLLALSVWAIALPFANRDTRHADPVESMAPQG